ncbi:hypothetical protein KSF73_11745 [Burkholderiaceae bacterium DAT-1]|nr:hypothetical protein [Burkholderiaceae bacterium DAT-1]
MEFNRFLRAEIGSKLHSAPEVNEPIFVMSPHDNFMQALDRIALKLDYSNANQKFSRRYQTN